MAYVLKCFVFSGLLLTVAGTLPAQSDSEEPVDRSPPPFTSLLAAQNHCESTQSKSARIHIQAVVNLWYAQDELLFVSADDVSIYVKLPAELYAENLEMPPGTQVEIRGKCDVESQMIYAKQLEILGHGRPTDPIDVSASSLAMGSNWSQRVRMQALVESVSHHSDSTHLNLRDGPTQFMAQILGPVRVDFARKLLGSKIELVATMDYEMDEFQRPIFIFCRIDRHDRVRILERADDSPPKRTPKPKGPISKIHSAVPGRMIDLSGQVTYRVEQSALIEDRSGGFMIHGPLVRFLELDEMVEISGTLAKRNASPTVNPVFIRRGLAAPPLPPRDVSANRIAGQNVPLRSYSIVGNLERYSSHGRRRKLLLSDGDLKFTATFDASDTEFDELQLGDARTVEIRGLVRTTNTLDRQFRIRASSPRDVSVLRRWERVDTQWLQLVGQVTLVLLTLATGWGIALRIQVRKKTRRLRQLTAHLNSSQEAIREGLMIIDLQGTLISSTKRIHDILQIQPDNRAHKIREQLAACVDDAAAFRRFWNECTSLIEKTDTHEARLRGGKQFVTVYTAPVRDSSGKTIARVWAFDDITERKDLESSLVQSQKMDAVGRLAGGVAHDFNNLLMAISGNLELAKLAGPSSKVTKSLEAAEMATDQAARLVKNLLGFSRQSGLDLTVANPNDLILDLYQLVARTLRANVEIQLALSQDLGSARLDQTQFQQVLLNICLNARDALQDGRGWIRIETMNLSQAEGDFIEIKISDNGAGMSDEVRDKIFEPFFTTKPTGKGTGLGLAMSYGIVRQHAGTISCSSREGEGTCFQILLPRCADEAPQPIPDSTQQNADYTQGGRIRVLLGEDSELIRESSATMLSSAGFEVNAVSNGRELIEAFEQDHKYDVAIVDLNMPVLSGRETFRSLRSLSAGIPIIMCSGQTFDWDEFSSFTGEPPAAFLQKPYRKNRLLAVMQGVLATSSGSSCSPGDRSPASLPLRKAQEFNE